jgi:hypothetical protein
MHGIMMDTIQLQRTSAAGTNALDHTFLELDRFQQCRSTGNRATNLPTMVRSAEHGFDHNYE